MRSNLTISSAWFMQLLCIKLFIKPDLNWWFVALPLILVPVEAVLTVLFYSRWKKVLAWYNMQIIKIDGRIRIAKARRQARAAYNKANPNKSKI